MNIYEVMTRGIETVASGTTLEYAAKKMQTRNIGFLPVVDSLCLIALVFRLDINVNAANE